MDQATEDNPKPKMPKRKRGIMRVEALLDAATTIFIEKGFDAATTAEIAERAGSSIGSLYQFFPTKESVADVLRARYGNALCEKWDALAASDEARTADALAAVLFRQIAETLAKHPAFPVLEAVRNTTLVNVSNVRQRYMDSLSRLLASRAPAVSEGDLRVMTLVVLQILRCEIAMEASPKTKNRSKVLSELQGVLANYLSDKIGPGAPD
jgi:AcrR family transcriptional regulator